MIVQGDPVLSEHAGVLAVLSFSMQGAQHHLGVHGCRALA